MIKLACLILTVAFMAGIVAPAWADDQQQSAAGTILKQGILGAAVGGIAAGASGGKAGKGALIGAGTNIAGEAILGALSGPSQPQQQPVYAQPAPVYTQPQPVYAQPQPVYVQQVPVQQVETVAQPNPYQQGYNDGYQKGFDIGYQKGYSAGRAGR